MNFFSAETVYKKAEGVKTILDSIHFHGIHGTKKDALIKESSKLFESSNLDELIKNAGICAKHLQEVGLFTNCVPFIDVSPKYKDGFIVHFSSKEQRKFDLGGKISMASNGEADASINFGKQSFNGRGESVNVVCSKSFKGSHSLDFNFNKPLLGWQRYENVGILLGNPFQHLSWNCADLSEYFGSIYYNRRFFNNKLDYNFQLNTSWRKLISNDDTPFPIRDQSGHTLKVSVEESYTIDKRDRPLLASKGILLKYSHEFAGLLGDPSFLKNQLDIQASAPFLFGTILSASFRGTHITSFANKKLHLLDSAYLGGPYDIRGFEMKSIGTRADHACLGGGTAFVGGLHIYRPLIPADSLFLHGFLMGGSVARVQSKGRIQDMLDAPRVSTGLGLTFIFMNSVRLEMNYVIPIRYVPGDATNVGFQFGAGFNFM
uniref:Bac_surface_Ag domain-containing protein n=1 Tax=Parastrongyloides trichosuri TaxID=131310 RepID=A0A0N4Z6J7_PARTI